MRRLTLLLALLALSTGALAQAYVELVLDASGSMWNKLDDGRYRITTAKEALSAFIRELPDGDLHVGLRVYGSRIDALADGACLDTELFVPLAGVDKAALQGTVDAVNARGATPIAASLQAAAADFPDAAARRVIVLVTDGQESCGGDLAAAVAGLEAAGIELRIIGFALPEKAAAAFAQLATFENATDAAALAGALRGVTAEVAPEPVESAEAKVARVTLEAPDQVAAGTTYEVRWSGEPGDNDELVLADPDSPEDDAGVWVRYVDARSDTIDAVAPLTAGEYELRYLSGEEVVARRPLTVTESPATLRVLDEAVFAGTRFEVDWTGPDGPRDYVTVVPPDAPAGQFRDYAYTRNGSPLHLLAPSEPGTYELRYQSEDEPDVVVARAAVEVLPPKPITLEAPATVTQGSEVVINWTGPDAEQDYVTIAPAGTEPGTYLDYRYTTVGSPITLMAPFEPGEYEIRYSTDRIDASGQVFAAVPLTVEAAGVTLAPPAVIRAGSTFTVQVDGPARYADYITIVPAGAPDGEYANYAYVHEAGPIQLQAPDEAGAYEIRYQSDHDPSVVMGRVAVTVTAP